MRTITHWIFDNRDLLNAESSLVIAAFTVVLIILNAIYVRANWKTMRLMQADVRFRTQPIPAMDITVATAGMRGPLISRLSLSTSNAPLRLASMRLEILTQKEKKVIRTFPSIQNRYLPPLESLDVEDIYEATEGLKNYSVIIMYYDLAGLSQYTSTFRADNTVATTIVPSPSFLARIWSHRPWARK